MALVDVFHPNILVIMSVQVVFCDPTKAKTIASCVGRVYPIPNPIASMKGTIFKQYLPYKSTFMDQKICCTCMVWLDCLSGFFLLIPQLGYDRKTMTIGSSVSVRSVPTSRPRYSKYVNSKV